MSTSNPPVDPKSARDWSDFREKAKCELYCLILSFIPHRRNNSAEKVVTILFVGTWCMITAGMAFGEAGTEPAYYGAFSALVFYMLGRIHDIEIERLSELTNVDISVSSDAGSGSVPEDGDE